MEDLHTAPEEDGQNENRKHQRETGQGIWGTGEGRDTVPDP